MRSLRPALMRRVGRLVRPHVDAGVAETKARVAEQEAHLARLEARVAELAGSLETASATAWSGKAVGEDGLARASHALEAAREALVGTRIAAFTGWLELRPPTDGPSISVVLPTRNRPALFPRALASVLRQRYERWQLVVVDDGGDGSPARALEGVDDSRVVLVEGPERGLSAARNAGLESADGDIVCYLDDDNVMHPLWLAAVAHVFAERADVEVAYGVTLAQHRLRDDLSPEGWWPAFWQLPWSREALLRENVADAGALAHRRALADVRFDETLATGEDWDLLIRLTADRDALAVPAVSHAYAMDGHGRLSTADGHRAGLEEIRHRHTS